MKRPQSEMQHKGASQRKYGKKLLILTTILVLVEFVSSFSTPTNPLQLAHHSRTSRSSSRPLTVLSVASTEILPELGRDGVYHITNPEQHKYVLFWKFKLPLLFPISSTFNPPPPFFSSHRALIEANQDKLMVMKVFAPWCKACKGLEPKFNAIVKDKKYKQLPIIFADLTIQNNKEYVKSIGVVALPSIQFYAHGQKMDTFPCGPSKVPILKTKLAALIDEQVDVETFKLKEQNKQQTKGILDTTMEAKTVPEVETRDEETVKSFVEKQRSNLRNIPYFTNMLESDFESLLSKASLLTFDSGSIIMREGNNGRTFYIIVEGEVEICQKTSFEDPLTTPPTYLGTVINRFVKGEYFGERALITGEPRAASIRTSTLTKCLTFDKEDFPLSCELSGRTSTESESQLEIMDEKYGVALGDISSLNERQYVEAQKANQARGSANSPAPIDGVDNDIDQDIPKLGVETDFIVPLLMRFKLIRLVTRCFDYMVANRPRLGDEGARRRRGMLVKLLSTSQQTDFNDAYKLIDADSDGEITLMELRRLMDSIGEEKTDADLLSYIESGNQEMDGRQVLTYEDFMGIMAEAEFYNLFYETFRALDKDDSGYLRASDLNRVLCGIRDLITDDRKSIIDVEDDDMSIDYEQFSKMLLGTALK